MAPSNGCCCPHCQAERKKFAAMKAEKVAELDAKFEQKKVEAEEERSAEKQAALQACRTDEERQRVEGAPAPRQLFRNMGSRVFGQPPCPVSLVCLV